MLHNKINNKPHGAAAARVMDSSSLFQVGSSFSSEAQSSVMPRTQGDVEVMGLLTWSSSDSDSERDKQVKKKRLNFLVDLNQYVTQQDLEFEEKARLRKEIDNKKREEEEKLAKRLQDLETQIRQAEEDKKQREFEAL